MCVFDGLRLKRTGPLANHESHKRQPWIDSANFRTSDEAACPLNFCRQIALRVSALAEAAGYIRLDLRLYSPLAVNLGERSAVLKWPVWAPSPQVIA